MSRSYRKPYGYVYLKDDRQRAARSVRSRQNRYLNNYEGDFEDFLIPDKYECSNNERWGWRIDSDRNWYTPKLSRWDLTSVGLHLAGMVSTWGKAFATEEEVEEVERGYNWYYTHCQRK